MISIYQGGAIIILANLLFEDEFMRIVSISFTSLIFNELLMVALEVSTWHPVMVYAQIVSLGAYLGSVLLLPTYFDIKFMATGEFCWKVALITGISSLPLYIYRYLQHKLDPPSYAKLQT